MWGCGEGKGVGTGAVGGGGVFLGFGVGWFERYWLGESELYCLGDSEQHSLRDRERHRGVPKDTGTAPPRAATTGLPSRLAPYSRESFERASPSRALVHSVHENLALASRHEAASASRHSRRGGGGRPRSRPTRARGEDAGQDRRGAVWGGAGLCGSSVAHLLRGTVRRHGGRHCPEEYCPANEPTYRSKKSVATFGTTRHSHTQRRRSGSRRGSRPPGAPTRSRGPSRRRTPWRPGPRTLAGRGTPR